MDPSVRDEVIQENPPDFLLESKDKRLYTQPGHLPGGSPGISGRYHQAAETDSVMSPEDGLLRLH